MDKLTKKPLVFICYAKQDEGKAKEISDELSRLGVDVWFDKEKLVVGDNWELEIEEAVKNSDAFLVLLRPGFEEIGFRQREVKLAIKVYQRRPIGKGFIIPFIVEPCELPIWCHKIHAGSNLSEPTSLDDVIRGIEKQCGVVLISESQRENERRKQNTIKIYGPESILFKQGEAKPLFLTVTDSKTGEAVNLTGATLLLVIKKQKSDKKPAISKSDEDFDKSQAVLGKVSVFLTATNTNQETGPYVGELKVTFPGSPSPVEKTTDLTFIIDEAVTD